MDRESRWRAPALPRGPLWPGAVGALAVAAGYYAGAQAGFLLHFPESPLSILWPPNAILLAALLLVPTRQWVLLLLAVLPAHLLVLGQNGVPLPTLLGLYLTNCAEPVLAAAGVRRCAGGPPWFATVRQVALYIVCAALVAPLVTSFLDVGVVVLTRWDTSAHYWLLWQERFASNMLTYLTVTPVILLGASAGRRWLRTASRRQWLEAAALALGVVVTALLVLRLPLAVIGSFPALLYVPVPVLLWAAVRFGVGGSSAAVLGLTLLIATAQDDGHLFARHAPVRGVLAFQVFLTVVAASLLLLAAFLEERQRAATALRELAVRRETEAAVRASEERLRTLIAAAPIGICTLDAHLHHRAVNEAYCALTGYTREELLGMEPRDLLAPAEYASLQADYARRISADEREPAEYLVRAKGGERRTVLSSGVTLVGIDGQPERLGFVIDITARKWAEEALRESEAHYRLLANNATDLISRHTPAGVYVYVSPACQALLGYAPDELIGRSATELAHPDDLPALRAFNAALPDRAAAATVTFRKRRKDGTYVWVETTSRAVRDPQTGAVREFQCATRDVTARRQAEDALRQANAELGAATQAKSAFLATMSHEMRTPLNGVIGLVSLLGDTPLSPQQQEYVSALHTSGDALLSLISDVLDFSKIEAGQLVLEHQPLDLRQLVQEVVALCAALAQAKGLPLHSQVDPAVPLVLAGDAVRLRQVLLNLLNNALKFTAQGEVGLTVTLADETAADVLLWIGVRDTGIGIAPEAQEGLFAPFVQADASTTRQYGGTGLGLAIVKQLVEAMSGQIGVQSTPGQGSTFWLTLRLARAPQAADTPAPDAVRGPAAGAGSGRILLAEDNAINRLVAVGLLERLGYAVQTVENGQQAVEAVEREAYDVVLMDVHMPEMDGWAATAAIRAHELDAGRGQHLPIVALTADALSEDMIKSRAAGMDDHLSKPLTLERLAAVLERWVPRRGERR